jgi:transcriptional regulator with XRE-family HTH domain
MTGADRVARQVGSTLRRLRERDRCRRSSVAAAAGITRRQLAAYEQGQERPSVPILGSLLAALDCSEDTFSRHFGPFGLVDAIRRTGRL